MSAAPRLSRLAALRAFSGMSASASLRSRAQGLVFFAMPVFVMAFVGLALRGYTTPQLVVGVLGESGSPAAQRLVAALEEDPHVRVRRYQEPEPMRLAVFRGRLHAGIRVPRGWEPARDLPVWASQAGAGTPTLRALLDRELARLEGVAPASPPPSTASTSSHTSPPPDSPGGGPPETVVVVVDGEALGSPPIGFQYTAPSNLVLFVLMNAILGSLGMLSLRRTGLGKRLVATPATRAQLTLALAVGPLQLMAVQAVFLLGVGAVVFGVSWGDPLGVALLTVSLVLAATGLYLLLGTCFGSEAQAGGVGPFLGIVLGMLGGCMWPLEIVPEAVARFGHFFPTAWAMDGYLALVFGRADYREVLAPAAILLAMGALFAAVGALRLRRQLGGEAGGG